MLYPGLWCKQEVEVGQVQGPLSLTAIELLFHPEILKVFVVCPNFKLVPCALKEMPPLSGGADNSKHLLVMGLIVPLYCIQALRVEGYGMPLTVLL